MAAMRLLQRAVRGLWFFHFGRLTFLAFVRLFYGLKIEGREKVPRTGGLVVAANHTNGLDPPVLGVSVPREINFMAKKELFENRWLGLLLSGLRAYPVDREANDIGAIKESLRRIRGGRALGIFAQGTRSDGAAAALDGAAFLAQRASVPLIPAAIWREGRRFHVRFGDPLGPVGRSRDEIRALTNELMHRVNGLLPGSEPAAEIEPAENPPTIGKR